MEFIGVHLADDSYFNGYNWVDRKAYIFCPTADPDKQMYCSEYKPCDYENWQCKFCECSMSDVCSAKIKLI